MLAYNANSLKRKNEAIESSDQNQTKKRLILEEDEPNVKEIEYCETESEKQEETHIEEEEEEKVIEIEDHATVENDKCDNVQHNIKTEEITDENSGKIQENPKLMEKEKDSTYVLFRMYCPVKEACYIVGKKGEKINHIRDKANVRINVSDNIKDVPERIILVRGPAENVARAFGLISRTILDEPEDEPASIMSRQYNLKILVPHPMVGYIIGKQGVKFREIEENSAAKLKAAEQPLPSSTDRVLSITGVGDAIHIAIYYISQVMIEHKDCLKKNKIIYYNPVTFHTSNPNNNMINIPMIPNNNNMVVMGAAPNHLAIQGMKDNNSTLAYGQNQSKQHYNFQMMFQPSIQQQHYGVSTVTPVTNLTVPSQNQYTDEHGNTIIGEVITNPPVLVGSNTDKFNQDIFVANSNIGSVIGRGGNNIKHIRENSKCTYVKIEPDKGQSIMLGGGKGLINIRKLTLTGSLNAIQTAIYLINHRIAANKERNAHQ